MERAEMSRLMNKEVLIPFGTVVVILSAMLAGRQWLEGQFMEVRTDAQRRFAQISDQFGVLDKRISANELSAKDGYSTTKACEDALRNAIANPGIRFSDPRNPGVYIRVEVSPK
jgi:hypothetical protein